MPEKERVALDTNTFVSGVLFPGTTPARAVDRVCRESLLLFSEATFSELDEVFRRGKFDRYLPLVKRLGFLDVMRRTSEFIAVESEVRVCRDPKDDKFLSLVREGKADFLVTGDLDLLALDPFGGCRILNPADFLSR